MHIIHVLFDNALTNFALIIHPLVVKSHVL